MHSLCSEMFVCIQKSTKTQLTCYSFVANHYYSYLRITIHSHAELSYQYFYLLLVSLKYPKTYFP